MLFRTATLGCKVNQYETQYIRTALLANGFCEAAEDENESVDWVIINTCSVTGESDAKSRKMISYWGKKCPQAKIIVLGCYATANPQKVASFQNVVQILNDKRQIVDFLKQWGLKIIPNGIDHFSERHRAYVKVQDGCRVGCAYCIIPKVRPYLSSRPVSDVIQEMRHLIQNGYREIVLTGIHLGHYGLDFAFRKNAVSHENHAVESQNELTSGLTLDDYQTAQKNLAKEQRIDLAFLISHLLDDLSNLPNSFRLRLGSLEAVEVPDRLLDVLANHQRRICHHLHLSMQSGDDSVLLKMRRRWLSGPFIEKCQQIQEQFPHISLTTDIIVGFPGETDSQFLRTCDVAELIGFSKIHIFRFSPRTGTIAAQMEHQIPESVKKERAAHLLTIADRLRRNYAQTLIGKSTQLLIEDIQPVSDYLSDPLNTNANHERNDHQLNIVPFNATSSQFPFAKMTSEITVSGTTDEYLPMKLALPTSVSVQNGDLLSVIVREVQGDHLIGVLKNNDNH